MPRILIVEDERKILRSLERDLVDRPVTRGPSKGALTQREFELLAYLARHKNATVTRDMLGREVWKEPGHALTNVIDVHVTNLRRKLERAGQRPLIQTVR